MIYVSSNSHKIAEVKNKIAEVKKSIPSMKVEKGRDLKEVDADETTIIVYKAIEAGKGYLVDDVILYVNGVFRNDVKWVFDRLKEGSRVEWITTLGYNDGKRILCFNGSVKGIIVKPKGKSKFGFDKIFKPNNSEKTLAELDNEGNKDKYSARFIALSNLKNKDFYAKFLISKVPIWKGRYQNE